MRVNLAKEPKLQTIVDLRTKNSCADIQDYGGNPSEVAVRYEGSITRIICGLGDKADCTHDTMRAAAACGVRKAVDLKRRKVCVTFPNIRGPGVSIDVAALEGSVLGAYSFDKFKTEKSTRISTLSLVSKRLSRSDVSHAVAVCESTCYARDLINDNAHTVIPAYLAGEARKLAASCTAMSCTVLDERAIDRKGLNLIKAVGQGSPYPPRLIILQYRGGGKSPDRPTIIGKGVTFDSGGQNLKPTGHIETMRCDMSGAAAVLGVMKALCLLKPRINVVGVIGAAHNALDGKSCFPGDIYTCYNGKTVEVQNTDAEGRLVLADAMAYCQKHYKPTAIIDLATLTGAIIIALGDTIAGLFSNDDSLANSLLEASSRTGESLWRLPIRAEHTDTMKSDVADIRNTPKMPKGYASSITAAAFLESFVENGTPWAHLDIAGTAFNDRDARGEVPKLGTGFGVRLLVDYLVRGS